MYNIFRHKYFKHKAMVKEINGNKATVELLHEIECASCHSRFLCLAHEKTVKHVDAIIPRDMDIHVGDDVDVVMRLRTGVRAIFLMFVLPTIIFLASLIAGSNFKYDFYTALLAVGFLAVYFFIIYRNRERVGKGKFIIVK